MNLPEFVYTVVLKPKPLRAAANATLRAICPKRKRVGDVWWELNPNDPVVSGAATLGLYEAAETAFFKRVCKPGMTFLDIGANTGYYSALAMSLMKGQGRIVALEPDPEARKYLESTRDANNCEFMSVVPVAASDRDGVAKLFTNKDNRGDNRLYENDLCSGVVEVECRQVDDVVQMLQVKSVDLIKIDVQGFEGHVLQGMLNTVRRSPNVTLLMEFWPWGLEKAGSDAKEILLTLENLGFSLFELMKGGALQPVVDHQEFIGRLNGRVYSNIVGFRRTAAAMAAAAGH